LLKLFIHITYYPHPEWPCLLRGSHFHDLGDDDEDVIFEETDDEKEGYLFARQYTYFNFYYATKSYINTHVLLIVFKKILDEQTDEDIKVDGTQDEYTTTYVPDPYNKVYSNIHEENTYAQVCSQLRLLDYEEV
jgi:hypothetical protein